MALYGNKLVDYVEARGLSLNDRLVIHWKRFPFQVGNISAGKMKCNLKLS